MTDLFVSYSRDDTIIMGVIRDNVRKLGFNLWIDVEHVKPGTPQWKTAIKQAIARTDGMIVLCSPQAEKSKWVNIEVAIADELQKPIFPIWVNGQQRFNSIPADLFNHQYVDMRGRSDAARGFVDLVSWLAERYGLHIPEYEFESYTGLVQLPTINVSNVTNHVEGSILNIEGDVVGDVNVAGRDINTQQSEPVTELEPEYEEPETHPEPEPEPTPMPVMSAPPARSAPVPRQAIEEQPTMMQTQKQNPTPMGLWLGLGGVGLAVVVGGILLASGGGNDPEPTQRAVVVETDEPTEVAEDEPQTAETPEIEEEPTEETPEATQTPDIPPEEQLSLEGVSANSAWTPYTQEFGGVEMALVPAGCFMMGASEDEENYAVAELDAQPEWLDDEQPVHEVCFDDPFWIDVYEVTNQQFANFLNNQGNQEEGGVTWLDSIDEDVHIVESGGTWEPESGFADHPAIELSWYGAQAYCEWQEKRLPTEAEWEYAARGPDNLIFPWSNEFDGSLVNFCDSNCTESWADSGQDDGYERTAPIGTYKDNVSWVGAYDMSGNVWEWVADWYDEAYYSVSPGTNPPGPNSSPEGRRVLRGGSWVDLADILRAAHRYGITPDNSLSYRGFRCARSYSP